MDPCPLCLGDLTEIKHHDVAKLHFYCSKCCAPNILSKYRVLYHKNNNQLYEYTLYLDDYCIKNYHDDNKTVISVLSINAPKLHQLEYVETLYLPLVHFEFYNLAKIRKQLQFLLFTM